MWVLWLFGNPVNRRLGNGFYLLAYLGTIVFLGLFARLFSSGPLLGASGAIFAVLLIFCMLMPSAVVQVGYVALLPITLLAGLIWRPKHWLYWFIRWDSFAARAWIGLLLVPILELWGLWTWGWNWTNLAHLIGLACGLAVVLLLPARITMGRRAHAGMAY
jgi:membrane associated rhomboid family serine protease